MKGMRVFIITLFLLFISISFCSAQSTKEVTSTNTITSGNNVCERYSKVFTVGESGTLNINGITFDFTLKAIQQVTDEYDDTYIHYKPIWIVDGKELTYDTTGTSDNDFFRYVNEKLGNVNRYNLRTDEGYKNNYGQQNPSISYEELEAYPIDCVGLIKANSYNTRLNTEIKITEGWNLIPLDVYINSCHNIQYENELCEEDILVDYYYNPIDNQYLSSVDIQRHIEQNFATSEEENRYRTQKEQELQGRFEGLSEKTIQYSDMDFLIDYYKNGDVLVNLFAEDFLDFDNVARSKWIYVKEGVGEKSIIHTSYQLERLGLKIGLNVLFKGWNFMYVRPEFVYMNDWYTNALSLSDLEGDCTIIGAHFWNAQSNTWERVSPSEKFSYDDIGKGLIIKVANDCRLSYDPQTAITPPSVPSTNNQPQSEYDFPEVISDYTLDGSKVSDSECGQIDNDGEEICVESVLTQYKNSEQKVVSVTITQVTSNNFNVLKDYLLLYSTPLNGTNENMYLFSEPWEIFWFTSANTYIFTQEYTLISESDGSQRAQYGTANGNNPVTKYFLSLYPPA